MKAEKRTKAFALFVNQGMSLRKIATELKLSRSTLERWCSKDGWVEKRRTQWESVGVELCEKHCNQHIARQDTIAGKLHAMVQFIHMQHKAYYEGKLPKSALKYSVRDMCRLAVSVHQIGLNEIQRADIAINTRRKN